MKNKDCCKFKLCKCYSDSPCINCCLKCKDFLKCLLKYKKYNNHITDCKTSTVFCDGLHIGKDNNLNNNIDILLYIQQLKEDNVLHNKDK